MANDQTILLGCVAAAALIALCHYAYRLRREALDEFERAFDLPDAVFLEEYRYSDESETKTVWSIAGKAGEFVFTFEAAEFRRADPKANAGLRYTLEVSHGAPQRFGGYGFGGENFGSKDDQPRLRALFSRLWPDGHYPSPDPRPERARIFAHRSS